jgi:hypothetical protein
MAWVWWTPACTAIGPEASAAGVSERAPIEAQARIETVVARILTEGFTLSLSDVVAHCLSAQP